MRQNSAVLPYETGHYPLTRCTVEVYKHFAIAFKVKEYYIL